MDHSLLVPPSKDSLWKASCSFLEPLLLDLPFGDEGCCERRWTCFSVQQAVVEHAVAREAFLSPALPVYCLMVWEAVVEDILEEEMVGAEEEEGEGERMALVFNPPPSHNKLGSSQTLNQHLLLHSLKMSSSLKSG